MALSHSVRPIRIQGMAWSSSSSWRYRAGLEAECSNSRTTMSQTAMSPLATAGREPSEDQRMVLPRPDTGVSELQRVSR
jgi:hypothetical protein